MSHATGNINDIFFNSSYKHAWKSLIPPGMTEVETDFIIEVCGLKPGALVLDLMCGYGRHALELGRRGIHVTAVDNLQEYIEEINSQAKEENLPVTAVCTNALDFQSQFKFDAIICMGNSFAFFDRKNAVSLLGKVASSLQSSGSFMINSWMVAEIAIKYFREHDWHFAGEYKCVLDYKYRFHPSRIESEQTIISPDGSVEILKGVDYIFSLNEMEEMCSETGMEISRLYGSPRKKPFTLGDNRIYLIARPVN